jgi:hypothetical protein
MKKLIQTTKKKQNLCRKLPTICGSFFIVTEKRRWRMPRKRLPEGEVRENVTFRMKASSVRKLERIENYRKLIELIVEEHLEKREKRD